MRCLLHLRNNRAVNAFSFFFPELRAVDKPEC
jgi:hypothetical protein